MINSGIRKGARNDTGVFQEARELDPAMARKRHRRFSGIKKEREIQHMIATSFRSADGEPISAEEFSTTFSGLCRITLKAKKT